MTRMPNPPSGDAPTPESPTPEAARDVRTVLLEAEHMLRACARQRSERAVDGEPAPGGGPAERAQLARVAEELETAAAAAPDLAQRHERRLAAVRGRLAIHTRDIPSGALDGLYDDVRAATAEASPWARSRMSDAFLDAPRQLARWRSTALAACALLAVGAGLFAGGRLGIEGPDAGRSLEREDPRDDILPRFSASRLIRPAARGRGGIGTLVSDPSPEMRAAPAPGVVVFYGSRTPSEAQRRLDSIQIFPVGLPAEDVEQN